MPADNTLYYGDNLEVLKLHIPDESVDLIYLDPPFNSNQDYNILFAQQDGEQSPAQIKAFEDTWEWDTGSELACQEIVESGGIVSEYLQAFRKILGNNNMMAYLSMMAPRLIEMRRSLRQTGSIYLHCDPTSSHYLKLLMDSVFGPDNFQNEIVWHYRRWTGGARRFQRMHDIILFYARDAAHAVFNPPYIDYTDKSAKRKKNYHTRIKGGETYVTSVDPRGVRANDVWNISVLNPAAKERLGYPTQKPEALLDRIIGASSNVGDVVLDPFCGCGTAVAVAQRLKRKWIGIDITHLAVTLIRHRLDTASEGQATYTVVGEPVSIEGAAQLAVDDPYQFQWWALGKVGARPNEQKKGADAGIDGRLYFHDEDGGKTKQIILSVKAGKNKLTYLRDLRGVVDREKAQIGVLLCMHPPTKPMVKEAASAGFYNSQWVEDGGKYPRLQILTVEDLLSGKGIKRPRQSATFKKAPKAKGAGPMFDG